MTNEVKKNIESEIDSSDGIVVPLSTLNVQKSLDDGNPNSRVGESFETSSDKDKRETQKVSNEEVKND